MTTSHHCMPVLIVFWLFSKMLHPYHRTAKRWSTRSSTAAQDIAVTHIYSTMKQRASQPSQATHTPHVLFTPVSRQPFPVAMERTPSLSNHPTPPTQTSSSTAGKMEACRSGGTAAEFWWASILHSITPFHKTHTASLAKTTEMMWPCIVLLYCFIVWHRG